MKIQYENQTEKDALMAEWVDIKGYRLAGELNHTDGSFLIFESPTDFHVLDTQDKWVFDKDGWLEAEIIPEIIARLRASDYKMLVDEMELMTAEKIQEWKDYRQALRSLPQTIGDVLKPVAIIWPKEPA